MSSADVTTANAISAHPPAAPLLLEIKNLKKYFPIRRGFFSKVVGHVKAVDDVSFSVQAGETLGLVGKAAVARQQLAVRSCGRSIRRLAKFGFMTPTWAASISMA